MDKVARRGDFIPAVLQKYMQLYAVISDASSNNVEFVVRPKLNPEDWDAFAKGTKECFAMLFGNNGIPLSYMIQDDTPRSNINPATTSRDVKLF